MSLKNPKIPEGINASQENPLKEFFWLLLGVGISIIIFVACISYFAQVLSPYIPFEWEESWVSENLANQLAKKENDTFSTSDFEQAQSALETILSGLQSKQSTPSKIKIHLIDSTIPNAFATLGGHIFINTGLLPHIESENGLAMVIAHEMAHVEHRHPIQSLSRGLIIQLVSMMIFADNSVSSMLNQTSFLALLRYNRQMESESDNTALITLQNYYGHTEGAHEFFQSMLNEKEGRMSIEFFNTHPDVDKRIHNIQKSMPLKAVSLTPLPAPLAKLKEQASTLDLDIID